MASKTKLFGYWISSVDEDSAKNAIKMAGLPVLLLGGNVALSAFFAFFQRIPNLTVASWCAVISLLLICIAFRIRAGKTGWMPFVLVLFAADFILSAIYTYIMLMNAQGLGGADTRVYVKVFASWVVPLICSVLIIAGFKGWLWLRANGFPRSM